MSKRTFKDYLHEAFFARDKASLAKIVKDAETAVPAKDGENPFAKKDDDDDKDRTDDGRHVHIHVGNAKDEKDSTVSKTIDERMTKVEDALAKMGKFFDALPKIKFKDGENPFAAKAKEDEDDNDADADDNNNKGKQGEEANGDDNDDPDSAGTKKTYAGASDAKGRVKTNVKDADNPFAKKPEDEDGDDSKVGTGDESGLGGKLTPEEEEAAAAMTAEKLAEAEPDLMDADPALKTGKNRMGDAKYVAAVNRALIRLVKDVRARAEILAPGIKFPTVDAAPGQATADAICNMRRTALKKASKEALGRFTANDMKSMSCAAVRTLFLDASDRQKALNNKQTSSYRVGDAFSEHSAQVGVLKQINTANKSFWEQQLGKPRV